MPGGPSGARTARGGAIANKALVTALVGLALSGCQGQPPGPGLSPGAPSGSLTWLSSGAADPVPGIDQGCAHAVGTAFLIWGDSPAESTGSGSSGPGGFQWRGHVALRSGRRVQFAGQSTDGKAGRVTIAGADYRLEDGNLFLVSGAGDHPRVKQLRRDLRQLTLKPEALKAFARGDAEVTAFFGGGRKPD